MRRLRSLDLPGIALQMMDKYRNDEPLRDFLHAYYYGVCESVRSGLFWLMVTLIKATYWPGARDSRVEKMSIREDRNRFVPEVMASKTLREKLNEFIKDTWGEVKNLVEFDVEYEAVYMGREIVLMGEIPDEPMWTAEELLDKDSVWAIFNAKLDDDGNPKFPPR
jgi:hypothetical protein